MLILLDSRKEKHLSFGTFIVLFLQHDVYLITSEIPQMDVQGTIGVFVIQPKNLSADISPTCYASNQKMYDIF